MSSGRSEEVRYDDWFLDKVYEIDDYASIHGLRGKVVITNDVQGITVEAEYRDVDDGFVLKFRRAVNDILQIYAALDELYDFLVSLFGLGGE